MIFEKAFGVFAPERASEIEIVSKASGAGVNYVIDMLISWAIQAKHREDLHRAAALLDQDCDAKKEKNRWDDWQNGNKAAKCFMLPTPPHIQPIFHADLKIPVVLECLYDRQAWKYADSCGYLTDRHIRDIMPAAMIDKIAKEHVSLDNYIDKDWEIFAMRKFKGKGKKPMAQYYADMSDDEFRSRMPFIEGLIKDISDYLFSESE